MTEEKLEASVEKDKPVPMGPNNENQRKFEEKALDQSVTNGNRAAPGEILLRKSVPLAPEDQVAPAENDPAAQASRVGKEWRRSEERRVGKECRL